MAGKFIKCPRCELNYINSEKQTYCDVCLAELKLGPSLKFADLEDEDIEEEILDICPVCKTNFIKFNEDVCEECRKEKKFTKDIIEEPDVLDDDWKEYLEEDVVDDDPLILDDDLGIDIDESELDEEADDFDDSVEDFDYDDGAEDDLADDYDDDFEDDDDDEEDFD